jgi:hypothetical protein
MPSTHKCPGCGRPSDDSRSLSAHKRYCKKVTGAASDTLKKRRHNIEAQEAAKVQRREDKEDAQRRREEIRDSTTEAEDDVPVHLALFEPFLSTESIHIDSSACKPFSSSQSSIWATRPPYTFTEAFPG